MKQRDRAAANMKKNQHFTPLINICLGLQQLVILVIEDSTDYPGD